MLKILLNERVYMKIAILYICTGKYDVFWKDFYLSSEKYFLRNINKEYFVFSDANHIFDEENYPKVHKIYQEARPWPYATLMRYHIFSKLCDKLILYDYIFFMNANVNFVEEIFLEEIIPVGRFKLVTAMHPGFVNKRRWEFSYERNPKSTAYIPRNKGKYYVVGGLNGGESWSYIEMIQKLKSDIDVDLENGIVAVFHDESHFNKYIVDREDVKILPPTYIWPENWKSKAVPKILLRDKSRYISFFDMRSQNYVKINIFVRIKNKLFGLIKYLKAK